MPKLHMPKPALTFILAGLALLSAPWAPASADQCSDAIKAHNARVTRDDQEFARRLEALKKEPQGTAKVKAARCEILKSRIQQLQNGGQSQAAVERICPSDRMNERCDDACLRGRIGDIEREIELGCRPEPPRSRECSAAIETYEAENKRLVTIHQSYVQRWRKLLYDDDNDRHRDAMRKIECERMTWHANNYLPFLQREVRRVENVCGESWLRMFNRATYQGADYFTNDFPKILKEGLAENCDVPPKINWTPIAVPPSVPTPTVNTGTPTVPSPSPGTPGSPSVSRPSPGQTTSPTVAPPTVTTPSPTVPAPTAKDKGWRSWWPF